MRTGVLIFVLLTCLMAVAQRNLLWALWGLWGVVPFALVCRLPPDVRKRLSRHFPP